MPETKHPEGPWTSNGISVSAGSRTIATAWPNPKADDGSMGEIARLVSAAPILDDLYASEINFSITTFWDGGWDVKLGDEMNGFDDQAECYSLVEAAEWLRDAAVKHYPASRFARRYAASLTEAR